MVAAYKSGLDVVRWERDSLRKGEGTTDPLLDKEFICYREDRWHAWGIFWWVALPVNPGQESSQGSKKAIQRKRK